MRKILIVIAIILATLLITFILVNEPRPDGKSGMEAEQLANKILTAVNYKGWTKVGAVKWSFRGNHHFLWDKQRNLVEIRWDDYKVLLNPETQTGLAYENEVLVADEETESLLQKAWSYFANDSFWLVAPFKLRDPGTKRELVKTDRGDALLVTYQSGGVTPGDSYLWIVDDEGLPVAWKMWVRIIPVGGMEFSWESWDTYTHGVKLASLHSGMFELEITGISTADTILAFTDGKDPFRALLQN